jgi:hypothetical protein
VSIDQLPPWPTWPSVIYNDSSWRYEWGQYHEDYKEALRARLTLAVTALRATHGCAIEAKADMPTLEKIIAACTEPASAQEIKRPSGPPPTATLCSSCNRMRDSSGETYGWGLCHCGSFRLPPDQPATASEKP